MKKTIKATPAKKEKVIIKEETIVTKPEVKSDYDPSLPMNKQRHLR